MHLLNPYLAFYYVHGRFGGNTPESVYEQRHNSYNRFLYVGWRGGHPAWLIKQPLWQQGNAHFDISHEAAINEAIARTPEIIGYVPPMVDYNPVHRILITEYDDSVITLADSSIYAGSKNLIEKIASMMAEIHFHLTKSLSDSARESGWYHFKPDILVDNVGYFNPILNNIQHSFVRRNWLRSLLLTTGFQQVLETLSLEWKSETAIHGDLHWQNILVAKDEPDVKRIRLCDWEFAGFGDKNWDFGCFFQGLLNAFVARQINPDEIIEAGKCFYRSYSSRGRELTGVSPIEDDFKSWFTLVLKLAGIDCIQKHLKLDLEHTGLSSNTLDTETARIEWLINRIITNQNVLNANW